MKEYQLTNKLFNDINKNLKIGWLLFYISTCMLIATAITIIFVNLWF